MTFQIVIGVLLVVGGGILIGIAGKQWSRVRLMSETPTSAIGSIKRPGFYEVNGVIRCPTPIPAPELKTDCVWYHYHVRQREYVGTMDGKEERWNTLEDVQDQREFQVADSSGEIWVDPEGAEIDAKTIRKRDRPGLGAQVLKDTFEEGVTGTETTLEVLEVGQRVYVLGDVSIKPRLTFRQIEKPLIISCRTESELTAGKNLWIWGGFIGGALLLVAGVLVLFVLG